MQGFSVEFFVYVLFLRFTEFFNVLINLPPLVLDLFKL